MVVRKTKKTLEVCQTVSGNETSIYAVRYSPSLLSILLVILGLLQRAWCRGCTDRAPERLW